MKEILAISSEYVERWECHKKGHFKGDYPRKKRKKLNTQAYIAKANRATKFDNDDAPLQANITTELLDNPVVVIGNSQILKDKQWFIDSYSS